MATPPAPVLAHLGLRPESIRTLKDVPGENASWLIAMAAGHRVVLRRYHASATVADLGYEHAVLRYLGQAGWVVPQPLTSLTEHDGAGHGARKPRLAGLRRRAAGGQRPARRLVRGGRRGRGGRPRGHPRGGASGAGRARRFRRVERALRA